MKIKHLEDWLKTVYKVHVKRLSYECAQVNVVWQMRRFFQKARQIFQTSFESKRELSFGRQLQCSFLAEEPEVQLL